jgi:hypothetical protein
MSFWAGDRTAALLLTALLGGLVLVGGCTPRTTPPGPATLSSSGRDLTFTYLQWPQGLTVLLVDDIQPGDHHSHGDGSTSNPVWTESGSASALTGRGYSWQLKTADGKTATFHLDGQDYDLAKGGLFVIRTKGEQVQVHQRQQDLATIPFDVQGCQEHLEKDPEVKKLLGAGDPPK